MTLTSSGVGGNIGGPAQPTPRDLEATAWTMVNKAALGLTSDTLEIPFSKLGGDVWKYQSDSNRPTLKPMGSSRTSTPQENALPDESWKERYQSLLKELPPDVKARLVAEMGKPFSGRDPGYSSLENLLNLLAKAMVALEKAAMALPPESPEEQRMLENQALQGKALRGAVQNGHAGLLGLKAFLALAGPNHPFHDDLNQFLEQGEEVEMEIATVLKMIQKGKKPSKDFINDVSNKAHALNLLFNRVAYGDDMLMMGPLFQHMASVASGLSLQPTSPTLFFGLKLASQGIFKSDSSTGLIGAHLQTFMKSLFKGVLGMFMNKSDVSKQMMLMLSLMSLFIFSASIANAAEHFGLGPLPEKNEGDLKEGKLFSFQLLLQIMVSSGLLNNCCRTIVEASGVEEKAVLHLPDMIELVVLLFLAFSVASGKPKEAGRYLEGLKNPLLTKLDNVEAYISKQIQASSNRDSNLSGIDIAVRQAKLAIKGDDFEALIGACSTALQLAGIESEKLIVDFSEFKNLALLMREASNADFRPDTGIIRAA